MQHLFVHKTLDWMYGLIWIASHHSSVSLVLAPFATVWCIIFTENQGSVFSLLWRESKFLAWKFTITLPLLILNLGKMTWDLLFKQAANALGTVNYIGICSQRTLNFSRCFTAVYQYCLAIFTALKAKHLALWREPCAIKAVGSCLFPSVQLWFTFWFRFPFIHWEV